MRNMKLDDVAKEVAQFIAQSGMSYECLNLDQQGVGEIYNVLEVTGLLPPTGKKQGKSDIESEQFRTRGNKAFVNNKDMEALELYTKAVCCAHPDGKEMALAYANRSAVTFALQEYDHSINDINRALTIGNYPDHLKHKLFERRGKCLLAMSQHEKALKDFIQVKNLLQCSILSHDRLDSLNSLMDSLIEKCQEKSELAEEKKALDFPTLSHGPSPYIQSASAAVDIAFTSQMGRHVIASTDIHPGDVLAIEKPYASVLLPSSYDFFCDNCKRRCHSSVPCLSCNLVLFCSESCRQASWTTHHSLECDILPTLVGIGCDKMELLAIRVLLLATKAGQDLHKFMLEYLEGPKSSVSPEKVGFVNDKYLSDDYISTHHLVTNQEARSHEDMIRRAAIAACLVHVLKEGTTFFHSSESIDVEFSENGRQFNMVSDLGLNHIVAADLLLRYLMSAPCNAHEIAEMRVWPLGEEQFTESTEIGSAVYPFHSLLNHSCDPNVVRHAYNGDTVVLSAIQFIPKGQQIFDNYGYHHAIHDLPTRHSHLKAQYFFTCECLACVHNWPLYHDLPDSPPTFISTGAEKTILDSSEHFSHILLEIKKGRTSSEDFLFLTKYLALLHRTVNRPWKGYNQCQEAIKQCLSLKANHYIYKKPRS